MPGERTEQQRDAGQAGTGPERRDWAVRVDEAPEHAGGSGTEGHAQAEHGSRREAGPSGQGVLRDDHERVVDDFDREADQHEHHHRHRRRGHRQNGCERPTIVHDLETTIGDITGNRPSEVGDSIQEFLQRYTDEPERLIGPITSIGFSVAGVFGALILILITAYFMAIRPQPLVDGLVRLVPPSRRRHALHVMERLRTAWIGWMKGVVFDMLVTGTLLYVGLTLIGLDFAILFAVLTALLVVVPYFGAIIGAIPPILFAFTDSPGKALAVLAVYVLVQQIESNLIVPLVMSRATRLHPALIAIGVVMVGNLFGIVGLFVAVPIISAAVILTEEIWVREIEAAHENRMTEDIVIPSGEEMPERGPPELERERL